MADIKDSSLAFFSKANANQWSYVLSLYKDVLKLKAEQRSTKKGGPEELIKLDTWFQEQLHQKIHSRKDPHIIHEELVQITRWKLMRGKFRPRLLDLVRINTETSVLQTSKKAFRQLVYKNNLSQAINALASLKGIGPATASAILAAGFPERAPYMADESMLSTPGVEGTDYTVHEYMNYAEQIIKCCDRLKQKDSEGKWTPHKVEMALWTHYLARELKPSLLDGMPPATDSDNEDSCDEKNDISEPSLLTSTITSSNSTAITLNGEHVGDDNSLSGPSSEVEDKSGEDSSSNILQPDVSHGNGNGNLTEDSKDFNSEGLESEENSRHNLLITDNSNDNAVDGEPAFKKQRTELSAAAVVAIGEDAQL